MFTRIVRFQIAPEKAGALRRDLEAQMHKNLPKTQAMHGYKRSQLLYEPKTGKVMMLNQWESEKDILDSAEAVTPMREDWAKEIGAIEKPVVEIYEVLGEWEGLPAGTHPAEQPSAYPPIA